MIGWDAWDRYADARAAGEVAPLQPYVRMSFHNVRGNAVAPLVIDGEVLGELATHFALLADTFDIEWHRQLCGRPRHSLAGLRVCAAPHVAPDHPPVGRGRGHVGHLRQPDRPAGASQPGAPEGTGGCAPAAPGRAYSAKELVKHAIDYMQLNLEEAVGVAEVAKALAVSPTYLGVVFRRHTGAAPATF